MHFFLQQTDGNKEKEYLFISEIFIEYMAWFELVSWCDLRVLCVLHLSEYCDLHVFRESRP